MRNYLILSLLLCLLTVSGAAADQVVNLTPGFNFIALTVQPATALDSDTLIQNNPYIKKVFGFDAAGQRFLSMVSVSGMPVGNTFNMELGRGYIIEVDNSGAHALTLVGAPVGNAADRSLVKGFNFIGFPVVTANPTISGLTTAYGNLKSIFVWNGTAKRFDFAIRAALGSDTILIPSNDISGDTQLQPGVAYFFGTYDPVQVSFGTPTQGGSSSLTATIDFTATNTTASAAPARSGATEIDVALYTTDGTLVANSEIKATTAGGATYTATFTGVDANVPYQIVAKGPNNEYVSGFTGTLGTGANAKTVSDKTTALAYLVAKDTAGFSALLGKSPSAFAIDEDAYFTKLTTILFPVIKTIKAQQATFAGKTVTLAQLRSEMVARIEIPANLSAEFKKAYTTGTSYLYGDPATQYAQAIALISSQTGKENADYLKQALAILGGISGVNTTTDAGKALEKNIVVAKAAAYTYLGKVEEKAIATGTTSGAPGRTFAAAYSAVNRASAIGDPADGNTPAGKYKHGYDEIQNYLKTHPTASGDPDMLALTMKSASELAEADPEYAEIANKAQDAFDAKMENDPDKTHELTGLGESIDEVDAADLSAEGYKNAGNMPAALEEYRGIDETAGTDAQKEKAGKTKNYGIGDCKVRMGEVEEAFGFLKSAVGDVMKGNADVNDNYYAKLKKVNEALLAMAAVIEKLQAKGTFDTAVNNTLAAGETANDIKTKFNDPTKAAGEIDRRSQVYTIVVVVVGANPTGYTGISDLKGETVDTSKPAVAQDELDAAMSDLDDYLALGSELETITDKTSSKFDQAIAALDTAALKYRKILGVELGSGVTAITAEGDENEATADGKKIIRIRSNAWIQYGMVYYYKFRVSILRAGKNDEHRKAALKIFYKVRERFASKAGEVARRISELEKYDKQTIVAVGDAAIAVKTSFDAATKRLANAKALIDAGDFEFARGFLEDSTGNTGKAIAAFKAIMDNPAAEAGVKKEAFLLWAEAKYYLYLAYDGADASLLANLKADTLAAIQLAQSQYPLDADRLRAFVSKLTQLDAFGQYGGTNVAVGVQAGEFGDQQLPLIIRRAVELKGKADQLYAIGEATDGGIAFDKARELFRLFDTADEARIKAILTDDFAAFAAGQATVETILGVGFKNGILPADARFTPPTDPNKPSFVRIVAAMALQMRGMLHTERYYRLKQEADRLRAIELFNKLALRYPDAPFITEVRRSIDELKGQLTTVAGAPVVGNVSFEPRSIVQGTAATINMKVAVADPLTRGIAEVKVQILFQGQLQIEVPLTLNATTKLYEGQIAVDAAAKTGLYDVVVTARNNDGKIANARANYEIKPSVGETLVTITDLYFENDRLVAILSGATTNRVVLDVLQPPPAGSFNPMPVPVPNYSGLTVNKSTVDPAGTRYEIPIASVIGANFPVYGALDFAVNIVDANKAVLFAASIPYYRQRTVTAADPVLAKFNEFSALFNYGFGGNVGQLAKLKAICATGTTTGDMDAQFLTAFTAFFTAASSSTFTAENSLTGTGKELYIDYPRPDLATVRAYVKRTHKYGSALAQGIVLPDGRSLLPPGLASTNYAVTDWLELQFRLINNRWYLTFDQTSAVVADPSTEAPYITQIYVDATNALQAQLSRPVDATKYDVKISVLRAPDYAKGILQSQPVAGFQNLAAFASQTVPAVATIPGGVVQYGLPLNKLIPSTFPVYGELEILVQLWDKPALPAAASEYRMPYYRPYQLDTNVETSAKARVGELVTALNALNLADFQKVAMYKGQVNDMRQDIKDWLSLLTANCTSLSVAYDPTTANVEPVSPDEIVIHAMFEFRPVYGAGGCPANVPFAEGAEFGIAVGKGAINPYFNSMFNFRFRRFQPVGETVYKWYWDTTEEGATVDASVPTINDMYLGGANDIVVETTVGDGLVNNVATYKVELYLMKSSAAGPIPVYGYTKKAMPFTPEPLYSDPTKFRALWKLPIDMILQGVSDYGDLNLEARLIKVSDNSVLFSRGIPYYRPYEMTNTQPLETAAADLLAQLNLKSVTGLQALWLDGAAVGLPTPLQAEFTALFDRIEQDGTKTLFAIEPTSVYTEFPRPDFAIFHAMMTIQGKHKGTFAMMPFYLGGRQWVPSGMVGQAFQFTLPLDQNFRYFNNKWYPTLDNPTVASLVTEGLRETWFDDKGNMDPADDELVVTVQRKAANLIADGDRYSVSASLSTPPNYGQVVNQPIPGAQGIAIPRIGLDAPTNVVTFKIPKATLFQSAQNVYGDILIDLKVTFTVKLTGVTRDIGFLTIPFYRQQDNSAVENPLKAAFTDYIAIYKTFDVNRLKLKNATGFSATGAMSEDDQAWIAYLRTKVDVTAFNMTVDPATLYVDVVNASAARVHGLVKIDFKYKADEMYGVWDNQGRQLLPPGPAGTALTSYVPFDLAFALINGVWYVVPEYLLSGNATGTGTIEPMIVNAYIDPTEGLVAYLNQPSSTLEMRRELMRPAYATSANGQPVPISGFSGTNQPKLVADGAMIKFSMSLVTCFPENASTPTGDLIVQVVLVDKTNPTNVKYVYNIPYFRQDIPVGGNTEIEGALGAYYAELFDLDSNPALARASLINRSWDGVSPAGGNANTEQQSTLDLIINNVAILAPVGGNVTDPIIEQNSLSINWMSPDFVEVYGSLQGRLRYKVGTQYDDVRENGLHTANWMAILPPENPSPTDNSFYMPFSKRFKKLNGNWYVTDSYNYTPIQPQLADGQILDANMGFDSTTNTEKLTVRINHPNNSAILLTPTVKLFKYNQTDWTLIEVGQKPLDRLPDGPTYGIDGVAVYSLSRTALFQGITGLAANGEQLQLEVSNGAADPQYLQTWNTQYYYMAQTQVFDYPVVRNGNGMGWYYGRQQAYVNGQAVEYVDLGPAGNFYNFKTAYRLMNATTPRGMVFSNVPGDGTYSDLTKIVDVAVGDIADDALPLSAADVLASAFPRTPHDPLFNIAILPQYASVDGMAYPLPTGFYNGQRVTFVFVDANPATADPDPVYANQAAIPQTLPNYFRLELAPGNVVNTNGIYGERVPFVREVAVTVPAQYITGQATSVTSIANYPQGAASQEVFNRPVIGDLTQTSGYHVIETVAGQTLAIPPAIQYPVQIDPATMNGPLVITGQGFGGQVAGAPTEVLAFQAYGNATMSTPVPIFHNAESGWSATRLVIPQYWLQSLPAGATGQICFFRYGDYALPLGPSAQFSIAGGVPERAIITSINNSLPDVEFIDLTAVAHLSIGGQAFGERIYSAVPTRDLVFLPFTSEPPVSIIGNNLTGWSDASIEVWTLPVLAGQGILMIRNLDMASGLDAFLSNPVPVKFANAWAITDVITTIDGKAIPPITSDSVGPYVNLADTSQPNIVFEGTFSTNGTTAPRYLLITDNPIISQATTRIILSNNVNANGWTANAITVPKSSLLDANNRPLLGATEDAFIFITNGYDVAAVPAVRVVSNFTSVTFNASSALTMTMTTIQKDSGTPIVIPTDIAAPAIVLSGATTVTITGTGFGAQVNSGSGTRQLNFNPDGYTNFGMNLIDNSQSGWSDTQITFTVPAGLIGNGRIRLNANDNSGQSNEFRVSFAEIVTVESEQIVYNGNVYGVSNGPTLPMIFELAEERQITWFYTYHYYNNGVLPGTVSFQPVDLNNSNAGSAYGPYQTFGVEGQGGVPNAYWRYEFATPLTLPAGRYKVIDSDNATWSYTSGLPGFFEMWGVKKATVPTGLMIMQVESHYASATTQANPVDMTGFSNPLFIVQADRELPGAPAVAGPPTYALFWQPLGGSPTYISVNINSERWKIDGNGYLYPSACLAPKQTGLGELFFAPVPPTDPAQHSSHVWVNFGGGTQPTGYQIDTVNNGFTTVAASGLTFNTPLDVMGAADSITFNGTFPAPTTPPATSTHRLVAVYPMNGAEVVTVVNTAASGISASWSTTQIIFPKSMLAPGRKGFLAIRDLVGGGDISNAVYFNNGYVAPTGPTIVGVNGKPYTASTISLQGDVGLAIGGSGFGAAGTLSQYLIFRTTGGAETILTNNGSAQTANWNDNLINVPDAFYFTLTGTGDLFIAASGSGPFTPLSNLIPVNFGTGLVQPSAGWVISTVGGTTAPTGDMPSQVAVSLGTSFNIAGTFPATNTGYGLFFFSHTVQGPPIEIPTLQWYTGGAMIPSLPQGVAGEGHLMVGPNPYNPTAQPADLSNAVKVSFPGGTQTMLANISSLNQTAFSPTGTITATGTGFDPTATPNKPLGLFYIERDMSGAPLRAALLKSRFEAGVHALTGWTDTLISGQIPTQMPAGYTGTGDIKIWDLSNVTPGLTGDALITACIANHIPYSNSIDVTVTGGTPNTPTFNIAMIAGMTGTTYTVVSPRDISLDPNVLITGSFPAPTTAPANTHGLFFVKDAANYEILKQTGDPNWTASSITAPKPMNLTGSGYLVIATLPAITALTEVSNRIYVSTGAAAPQVSIANINGGITQGGTITTSTCQINGTGFGSQVTSGPATREFRIVAYPNMNTVLTVPNTAPNWNPSMIMVSLPAVADLPNGSYEFGIYDVSGATPQMLVPFSVNLAR